MCSTKGLSSDNYVVIQGWMCNDLNLKGNDLLVFALIYGFSQDGKSVFNGGRKYIADTFNITLPTVDKALQNLVEMGIVIKESSGDYIHADAYRAAGGSKEILLGVVKKFYQGSKEILPNNIDNNIIDNIDISTKVEIRQPKVVATTPHSSRKSLITATPLPKEKKKNLYEQCMDLIDEYTQDRDVNEKLKEYLLVRLERTDKPFGVKTFGSILKKLSSLSQIKSEQLQIIQYSIDGQYPSFYELRSAGVGKKRDIFNEFGIVKSVAVNKEAILNEKF